MRGVKTDILELFIACKDNYRERDEEFDSAHAKELFNQKILPSIMNKVLQDYHTSPPATRDHKVLVLFSTAISVLKDYILPHLPRILNALFEKTLEMITTTMLDYPEHRIAFFTFIHEANSHCFYALFSIPAHLHTETDY